jgi:Tfp pilus assembly major pilin PilA
MKKMKRFFTLLELVMVIAVIVILISLIAPSFQRARSLASVAGCSSPTLSSCKTTKEFSPESCLTPDLGPAAGTPIWVCPQKR